MYFNKIVTNIHDASKKKNGKDCTLISSSAWSIITEIIIYHGKCPDLDKMKANQQCRTSVNKVNRRNLSCESKQFVKIASKWKCRPKHRGETFTRYSRISAYLNITYSGFPLIQRFLQKKTFNKSNLYILSSGVNYSPSLEFSSGFSTLH